MPTISKCILYSFLSQIYIRHEGLVYHGDLRLTMESVALGGNNSGIQNGVNYGPITMTVHNPQVRSAHSTTLQPFVALTLLY